MKDISVIIPIHKMDEVEKTYFDNAIASLNNQTLKPNEVILVIPADASELSEYLKAYDYGSDLKVRVVNNDGKTDFSSQINYGVSQATTEWVNFMELDDEMANLWIDNVKTYAEAYPEVGMFSPIVVDVNEDNQFISLTNEAVWARDFSDEMGVIDHDIVIAYQNFNIVGTAIKKELFEEFGGFKTNIKLYFIYEFLLRMTLNSVKIMVIPKYGHKHVNLRKGSLFTQYRDELNPVETKWWLAQAKKEYHFSKDREITYS